MLIGLKLCSCYESGDVFPPFYLDNCVLSVECHCILVLSIVIENKILFSVCQVLKIELVIVRIKITGTVK